jgi:hypothetical protein
MWAFEWRITMMGKLQVICFILLPAAGFTLLWGCDGNGKKVDADVVDITDGVDEGGIDFVTDEDVVTDPFVEDAPAPDVPEDGQDGQDGQDMQEEDVIGDVEEEEAVHPGEPQPYQCETAGGAVLTSDNYRLEVFVAPVRPIGNLSSTNYRLKLGPAGLRSPP